jgi:YggT family protein
MVLISVRIILTWFTWSGDSGLVDILSRITDPYLDWFRRFSALRVGFLDLSPIVALGLLSLLNRILSTLAYFGRITIGIILALAVQAVWAAVSFILGFLIVILILRLIAQIMRRNINSPFWRIVDTISKPALFRINRFIFKDRIVDFRTGIILSIVSLALIYMILQILVFLVSGVLARLPL